MKCIIAILVFVAVYKPKFAQPFAKKRDRDDYDDRYEGRGADRYERGGDRYSSSRHRGSGDSYSDRYSDRSSRREQISPRANQGEDFLHQYSPAAL